MKIRIGLMGMEFNATNFGVGALSFSQLMMIDDILAKLGYSAEYIVFSMFDGGRLEVASSVIKCGTIAHTLQFYPRAGVKGYSLFRKMVKSCDVVFDISGGDSFSDIYGQKRMVYQSIAKLTVLFTRAELVLAPQTYGPYQSWISRRLANFIFKRTKNIFSRDELSCQELARTCPKAKVRVFTDVAFYLPYTRQAKSSDGALHVGLNVSALLYHGGYTRNNQFNLTLDYAKLMEQTITELTKKGIKIHLIAHVYAKNPVENDYTVCEELHRKYPETILAPVFQTPMEAKSYISGLDLLIGSRMHATIAAFSSGVSVIPVSYSKKFNGLYENLGYGHVVDGRKLSTDEALAAILDRVERRGELQEDTLMVQALIGEKLAGYVDAVQAILEKRAK